MARTVVYFLPADCSAAESYRTTTVNLLCEGDRHVEKSSSESLNMQGVPKTRAKAVTYQRQNYNRCACKHANFVSTEPFACHKLSQTRTRHRTEKRNHERVWDQRGNGFGSGSELPDHPVGVRRTTGAPEAAAQLKAFFYTTPYDFDRILGTETYRDKNILCFISMKIKSY
ncbi:hypothetical protein EVAR_92881_1 [Eumeta japonica]|uniref:Uncharacterized protein n=1 Tax=Eumeta variegata TaxID=151549 RepID=A0A4C1TD24_EUMVA|nr:hypothetical protein EVAR_92881_1 [Eumeta japonica]